MHHVHLEVVAVHVLAAAFVVAQRVRGGEDLFYGDFEHYFHCSKKLLYVVAFGGERVIRQAVEENLPVARLGDAIIQQRQHPAIGAAADQPAETLFQRDGRLRDLIARKRDRRLRCLIAAMRASTTGSLGTANGSLSMITQLNCSPGTSTPCQNDEVANSTALRRGAEFFEQRAARAGALQERLIGNFERHAVVDQAHLLSSW